MRLFTRGVWEFILSFKDEFSSFISFIDRPYIFCYAQIFGRFSLKQYSEEIKMAENRLIIRRATQTDFDSIGSFYSSNKSKHVVEQVDNWEQSINDGMFIIIETRISRDIVAATTITKVPDEPYCEFGNTLVKNEYRGFGIQKLFFEIRATLLALQLPKSFPLSVIDKETNPISYRSAKKCGFIELKSPTNSLDAKLKELCRACSKNPSRPNLPKTCCGTYLIMPRDVQQQQVARFIKRGFQIQLKKNDNTELFLSNEVFSSINQNALLSSLLTYTQWKGKW